MGQKETFRSILRVAADKTKGQNGLLARAGAEESLLHQNTRTPDVKALPEKLVTPHLTSRLAAKLPCFLKILNYYFFSIFTQLLHNNKPSQLTPKYVFAAGNLYVLNIYDAISLAL